MLPLLGTGRNRLEKLKRTRILIWYETKEKRDVKDTKA